jgi:cytochrome P450
MPGVGQFPILAGRPDAKRAAVSVGAETTPGGHRLPCAAMDLDAPPADPIAAVTHPDPYPFYAGLARERPIYRDEALGFWVVSSAAGVSAVLASGACRVRPPAEPVPRPLVGSPTGAIFRRLVRMNDASFHRRTKPVVAAALASLDAPAVAVAARRRAAAILGGQAAPSGAGLGALAFRLPVETVASLLGVADDRLAGISALAGAFVRALAPDASAAERAEGAAAAEALAVVFGSLLHGGKGGLLARAAAQGLDADVVVANAIGFLFQAHDATAGLIGNALVTMAAEPDAARRALTEPALLDDFLDEVLRADPPVQNTRRFVAAPTAIAGAALAPGEAVLLVLAAANRDPALNPDPDHFVLERPERRLVTFGAGRHACPGERIAKTIAAAALQRLAPQLDALAPLIAARRYRPSPNARIPVFGT